MNFQVDVLLRGHRQINIFTLCKIWVCTFLPALSLTAYTYWWKIMMLMKILRSSELLWSQNSNQPYPFMNNYIKLPNKIQNLKLFRWEHTSLNIFHHYVKKGWRNKVCRHHCRQGQLEHLQKIHCTAFWGMINNLVSEPACYRGICLLIFFKMGVLSKFAIFTGKHLCWSLFLIKLTACNFIKKRLQHRCFPVNIAKF